MPDTTIQFANPRRNVLVDSLRGVGQITPAELVRVDPVTYDQIAEGLIAAGVRISGDTVLEFGPTPPAPTVDDATVEAVADALAKSGARITSDMLSEFSKDWA